MSDLPDHLANALPGSTYAALAELPLTGVAWHDCEGRILHLPRTGLTVVPFRLNAGGGSLSASCAVVEAPEGSLYPVGGFHIDVCRDEIERGVPRELVPIPAEGGRARPRTHGEVFHHETPRARCLECGRETWQEEPGDVCGFPQPERDTYCQGVFA
jgi:hypothetical protein